MILWCFQSAFINAPHPKTKSGVEKAAEAILRKQILAEADWAMQQKPITVTASFSPRSAGGKHDFFSEADYFWPDPQNPDGPYINRDGESNPANFVEHRKAMIRFSEIIGALASAYKITGDPKYVRQAIIHLKAWFIDPETLMNPNLQFAQAIKGKFTGRNYGIIDSIHLMEVAQGLIVMEDCPAMDTQTTDGVKKWFADYTNWLLTSKPVYRKSLPKTITQPAGLCRWPHLPNFVITRQSSTQYRLCTKLFCCQGKWLRMAASRWSWLALNLMATQFLI
jgi:hypothetical protein